MQMSERPQRPQPCFVPRTTPRKHDESATQALYLGIASVAPVGLLMAALAVGVSASSSLGQKYTSRILELSKPNATQSVNEALNLAASRTESANAIR